jgi:putative selenium metabolism protein SsnA
MKEILIHNVCIFTNDPTQKVLTDHAVLIRGTKIVEIGKESLLRSQYPKSESIDGHGRLLMPGLINTHMHFYSAFARGIPFKAQPNDFGEILSLLWWKLDRSLDSEAVYYSALVSGVTAVKSGVTSIIDHHASPNAVDGSLDRIEQALEQLGLRGVLCYEVSDRDGKEIGRTGLRENERFARKCIAANEINPDHPIEAMIGLHASFTLDEDTLEAAGALSESLEKGCHIHLCEDLADSAITREKYDRGVFERLYANGILGARSITAHGIHVDDTEKDILAETDTILVHNPQSNMNNAVGKTDIFSYLDRGVLLGLGTDGMSADIRSDVRASLLLQKQDLQDSNVGWSETEQMTLRNNPLIMQRMTDKKLGRVAVGYLADLILVDYYPPTPLTAENFWGHFLFGVCDATVDTTIVNGEIIMQNQQLKNIDEARIAAEARVVARKVWNRFSRG